MVCRAGEVEYRDVRGYPGYRVGSDGSVWSQRRSNGRGGGFVLTGEWRLLTPQVDRKGYLAVKAGSKTVKVHRLVLEAFVGPCPDGMQACQDDGNPSNNRVKNLRWDTPEANIADRDRHGTTARGVRNAFAKLDDEAIREIRRLRREGWSQPKIAAHFGTPNSNVNKILKGKAWKHVQEIN
jgi:hypothetical protein